MANIFLSFNWYGFVIASGILIVTTLAYFTCKRRGTNPEVVLEMVLIGLPMAVIGCRLYFCIFDGIENGFMPFWDWFKVWQGGLAIYGGFIGAVGAAFVLRYVIFKNRPAWNRLSLFQMLDLAFSVFLLAQAIGRWGNFANGELYGQRIKDQNGFWANFPFAVNINGTYYQATFFYESMLNLVGFCITFWLYNNKKRLSFDGFVFAVYCVWYGIVRSILEGTRQSRYIIWLIPDVLPVSVLVSFLVILGGAAIIGTHLYLAHKNGKKPFILRKTDELSTQLYGYTQTVAYMKASWDYDPYQKTEQSLFARKNKQDVAKLQAQDEDNEHDEAIEPAPQPKKDKPKKQMPNEFDD